MKKLVSITVIVLCLVFTLNAQTQKGIFLLGAGSNLSLTSTHQEYEYQLNNKTIIENSDYSSFNFKLNAGYFVIDNLALGISTQIYHQSDNNGYSNSFKFGPFGRYYFGTTNLKPFLSAQFGLTTSKQWDGSYIGIGGGLAIFITKNLAFEVVADYIGSSESNNDDTTEKYRFRDLSLSLGFGWHF